MNTTTADQPTTGSKPAKVNYLAALGLDAEHRFTRLYADYFERARDLVIGMYRLDMQTAEDVAQTVFTNVWREVAYIDPARERTYIFTLATHEAISVLRQRQRRGPHTYFSEVRDGDVQWSGRPVGVRQTPDVEAVAEQRDLLQRAIARCHGERQRNVVLLRLAGFKGGEIAEALGVPEATVRSDIRRHLLRCGDLAQAV
jgi:RNA polymerase sigma factor (sigma-70 family)